MLVPNIEIKKNIEENILKIDVDETIKYDFRDNYSFIDESEESKEKYFKSIEKIIRYSTEYRNYIWTLKTEFDLTSCKILKNININENDISLEFHHYPFTLYDIVNIVYNDLLSKCMSSEGYYEDYDKNIGYTRNPYYIANIIMKLHYENKIGLVPLTKTVHELVHKGDLFIPLTSEFVFGSYKNFMKEYNYDINNYEEKISNLIKLTSLYLDSDKNFNIIDSNNKLSILETNIIMKENLKPQKINIPEIANLA